MVRAGWESLLDLAAGILNDRRPKTLAFATLELLDHVACRSPHGSLNLFRHVRAASVHGDVLGHINGTSAIAGRHADCTKRRRCPPSVEPATSAVTGSRFY